MAKDFTAGRCPGASEYVYYPTGDAIDKLRSENARLRDALGLLRGHVTDDEGWRIINDALSLAR